LFIPDNVDWIAIVAGAILPLIYADNFEAFGTATPQQCADVFQAMFDNFSYAQGVCRVVGEIICYAGATSPTANWLLCDGSSLLRGDYADLFTVIGTNFGAVDSTHFSLPDLRSSVAIGVGTGPSLSTYTLGQTGGEETHTLTTAETPAHTHTDTGHLHTESTAFPAVGAALLGVPIPSAVPLPGVTGVASANLANTGGDGAHNNIQPYLALNFFIVALP
jgi:microcystin-dependent protein